MTFIKATLPFIGRSKLLVMGLPVLLTSALGLWNCTVPDSSNDSTEPPRSLNCQDLRIGGTSVGCGNPTKSVALNPIPNQFCDGKEDCVAGYPGLPVRISTDSGIGFHFLKHDVIFQAQPDSFRDTKVEIRYGGQINFVDSLPLAIVAGNSSDTMRISYRQICDAVDKPDHVCSDRRLDRIPVTLTVQREAFFESVWIPRIAIVQGMVLNTQTHLVEVAPESPWLNNHSFVLEGIEGYYRDLIDTSNIGFNFSAKAVKEITNAKLWAVFIPGANHSQFLCGIHDTLDLGNLPMGKQEIHLVPIPNDTLRRWLPVFQLDTLDVYWADFNHHELSHLKMRSLIDSLAWPVNISAISTLPNCR